MRSLGRADCGVKKPASARIKPLSLGLLKDPALSALTIYIGAWLVADEVHAAEASGPGQGSFAVAGEKDVTGWKKALVGICPAH